MQGEVIATGDELVSGQRLDTNSQWLSERLGELGVSVVYHTTVGDSLPATVRVFREALQRADVIVCTGGLGPTADDLVRQGLAEALGVELTQDAAALAQIRAIFARRKREMPERNVVQALFPRGSRPIENPHGTAPGIQLEVPRPNGEISRLFALPGVPAEMRQMWSESVAPAILVGQGVGAQTICHRRIKCFGAGESQIEQMLPDIVRRGREPRVGITASKTTITLRVSAVGESSQFCEQSMAPTIETIRSCLGSLVFGEGDDELQHAVARILTDRGVTLATAEWGTGGLVAHWLSELQDYPSFFRGGIVNAPHPLNSNARSDDEMPERGDSNRAEKIMRQIALSVRGQFDAHYGLAVCDCAASSRAEDSLTEFVMALASGDGVEIGVTPYAAHPDLLSQLSAKRALDFVRLAVPPRHSTADGES